MITIENLTYNYPNTTGPALREINLAVRPGEFVLLTGPSGAGKSTLLRTLNGLVPHFSGGRIAGRVRVAGRDPLRDGPRLMSQLVGMVFQNPEAQSVLDQVEAEIAFGLENAAIPSQEMRLRVAEVLDLLELTPLRQRSIASLSGGERQRVAIATALALRPQILALDEPTSQLDPKSAEDLLHTLVRLNEDLGLTILLAEHRLERIVRYAERLVYLTDGAVALDGPVADYLAALPQLPPVATLGRALGWQPLPLTVKAARRLAPVRRLAASSLPTDLPDVPRPGHLPDAPLLQAEGVRFAYGRQPVLRGVDLAVRPGEAVVLMGRNGSGKSTLLKCLVGLLRPGAGQIRVQGRSIAGRDVADICRAVAYLPQNPDDLLFAETVTDELLVTLHNHDLARNGAARAQAHALLDELDLAAQASSYPRDLSVGQRQRVALGAVMVTQPQLLLLDEPTRGLDYAAKHRLVSLWQRWRAAGMGLLLVTHDVELAAQVADRVVVLNEGEVIASGPAGAVLSASPLFAPQMVRLFPGRGWLTVEQAIAGLRGEQGHG